MKKTINIFPILLFLIFSSIGCTKLNEQVLDEANATNLTDKQAAEGLIGPVYARLPDIFLHTNYFALQEISTDEAILPYRGNTDWFDNGIYLTNHKHEFMTTDNNIKNTWNFIFQSISRSISAINQLPSLKDPSVKTFTAEARAMRAYYSLLTLDLYGVVFVKDDPSALSDILRGNAAVEYIKKELLAAEPDLETVNVTHGRMSKSAVWGMLARLYLNAAVYRNIYAAPTFAPEDMDKVIEYCDKIISSNNYQLSPEYFAIFDDNNDSNKEIIFAVDQRSDLNGHNRMAYFSLSGDQWPLPDNVAANGTDGPAITSDFYKTWQTAYAPADPSIDPRFYKENLSIYSNPADSCVPAAQYFINRGILRGQQYGQVKKNGVFMKCVNGNIKVGPLYHDSRSRPDLPVIFTENVDFTPAGSNYPNGYRVSKYMFSRKSVNGRNFGEANIVILRLADIYLMRAEAKLRKNNDAAAALADVNTVRASRTARQKPPALTSMTLDILYRERGFEFYWECLRRTDMIRFGKYEGTWTEKTNTDVKKRLMPIPQTAIDGASNLKDYLKQNDSY
ncbi:RagB/SusD family nutrient uptake outer membrane protein [Paraflavitalea soli]|uniref:RagB/SusD family nutrient uptake outer membrane protein n=1 Tax=Paraflavitalea soli TaxID=2315862 RepID=A0A3B7MTP7_9BACT|nr:RagB/SusD family nutrient uptake outer membrane protein [Paraflavitalea soli]AXY76346.1 RagB/SusD family nutrient uptake outer membrane protein [Paraflavitalea soli]